MAYNLIYCGRIIGSAPTKSAAVDQRVALLTCGLDVKIVRAKKSASLGR